jgi:short subunit fatty acids transporter
MSHSSQTQPEQQALPHFYTPAPPTNTMAILSLVFAFVFWPLSIAFGHVAHRQIHRTGEGGSGLATAGLVISYFGVGFMVLVFGLAFALPLLTS